MAAPLFFTRQMVLDLPADRNRYETVWGELLVTPAPRYVHQGVQMRLIEALAPWTRKHRIGALLASPADISWGPDILVQPDLFVVAPEEARLEDWDAIKTLLLVIEILSPSTTRQDRFTKRRLYQQVGVPAIWLVDCDARHIEVWTPDATFPVFERERATWSPAGVAEPLIVGVPELFQPL